MRINWKRLPILILAILLSWGIAWAIIDFTPGKSGGAGNLGTSTQPWGTANINTLTVNTSASVPALTVTTTATVPAVTYGTAGSVMHVDTVTLTNAEIKALRATPKVIVASPGAGKYIEVISFTLILNYGSNVLTESTDNLALEYGTSNDDILTIEMTGFIDQSADTIMVSIPTTLAANAATDMVNNTVELFNSGDGEFGGNAGNDTTLIAKIAYIVHTTGL